LGVLSPALPKDRTALRNDVDLTILDLVLPGDTGLEVLRHVRAARPDLPVIALGARGEVEDPVVARTSRARRRRSVFRGTVRSSSVT
jgi:DNA-binding response OmpR family regulator